MRSGPLRHRLFAIEYYNPIRNARHKGRFFKKPNADDLALAQAAAKRWEALKAEFVPTEHILPGDETDRLHRWGYNNYYEIFNPRQRLGLELSCRLIAQTEDQRIRYALATNLSDLLRYQNMLCRYDTMALKSLDIFSIHGFPVGLVQCESNLLGIINGKGINVGSGGWSNIISKYAKAKRYCTDPFEVRRDGSRNVKVSIKGEWIGEKRNAGEHRKISIQCTSATSVQIPPKSLDAVFTDPPYFGNIQYGELMDFCYVWLRRLVDKGTDGFDRESTRSPDELTRNVTAARGIEHFTEGLAAVYTHMAEALKTGAPLVFTYHHNKFEAYYPVGVAILDAGLTCSASLPCPAEMGGSIHIHGTSSSIVDTVFVCRSIGSTRRRWLFATNERLAEIVANDLSQLEDAGMKPTQGDIRCIIFGHITRMTIWNLRQTWNAEQSPKKKLQLFREVAFALGDTKQVMALLNSSSAKHKCIYPHASTTQSNSEIRDAVSF
jgi:hypothetical protein